MLTIFCKQGLKVYQVGIFAQIVFPPIDHIWSDYSDTKFDWRDIVVFGLHLMLSSK